MAGPWVEYLREFEGTLARPRQLWSEAETADIWNSLAGGPVGRYLYCCALRRIGNHHDAEDVLQGLLIELSMDRTYDPTGRGSNAFATWVHACLRNHISKFFKKRRGEPKQVAQPIDSADDRTEAPGTDGGWAKIEAEIDTETMLSRLPLPEREVVARRSRGESAKEIAEGLGLTETNVRQIWFRAKRNIRKTFGISIQ